MEKRIRRRLPNQEHPMTSVSDGLASLLARNGAYIPGGVSSTNRIIDPPISFSKAQGAYLWDIDGKRYVDYHAAFTPHFLGHNFAPINEAVIDSLRSGASLFGAGPSQLEGRLAELLCKNVAAVDKVCLQNTGSEATSLAIRLSRAITGRQHFIVVQGAITAITTSLPATCSTRSRISAPECRRASIP